MSDNSSAEIQGLEIMALERHMNNCVKQLLTSNSCKRKKIVRFKSFVCFHLNVKGIFILFNILFINVVGFNIHQE